MDNIHIRKIKKMDINGIAKILSVSVEHLRQLPLENIELMIHSNLEITSAKKSNSIYIAEFNNTVIGYISIHWFSYFIFSGLEGYISELYVSEQYRGRKVGTLLLNRAITEAQKRNCCRLSLLNDKRLDSYKKKFYGNQGWIERPNMANFVLWIKKKESK